MAVNLSAIQWIEVIVALLLLAFSVVVFAWVVKFYELPFNKFWKTRALYVVATFGWILSLLLGRDIFWSSGGLVSPSISEDSYKVVCQITMLFTFGISQPLFFIILLFMIRSKTNAANDLDLYNKHPNQSVTFWAVFWTFPMIAIHVIIVGLNYTSRPDPNLFWTPYNQSSNKCAVPIISTMAFTCFYAIFLVCYIFYSRKFSKTLINKRLLQRVWWSQIFFSLFFPFEVLLRFILIFLTGVQYEDAATILSHIFFFIDLIICLVGLLEFALFPVLDAAEYPLSSDFYDNLIDKRTYRKTQVVDHNAIMLDNVTFEAKKQPSSAAILTANSTAHTPSPSSTTTTTSSSSSSSSGAAALSTSPKPLNTSSTGSASGTSAGGASGPAAATIYNSNVNEPQSVEEFRKQMARYSSH